MKDTNEKLFGMLIKCACEAGAYKASVITTDLISADRSFRDMCAQNRCGMYGRCYMCPPDVGDIDQLMGRIRDYSFALVYQTVTELEDSYDFEGMVAAREKLPHITLSIKETFERLDISSSLHLSAGGCGVCGSAGCAKLTNEPCRHPDKALPSLEAYGINVSKLASSSGMKYVNGQNTVTYFGASLFNIRRL